MDESFINVRNGKNLPKIKFSHKYTKMPHYRFPFVARLLQCFKCHYNDLDDLFIKYDTQYIESDDVRYYPLPKTDLIVLLLLTKTDNGLELFTTVRSHSPKKWNYYNSKVGEFFEIAKA